MKNPAPYIRQTLVALLNNQITYDSVLVPCYEGEGEVTAFQILLQDQTLSPAITDDKHSFNNQFIQTIEIVSEQATSLYKHVDAIGASVMNLIKPDVFTTGIGSSTDFQVHTVKKTGQNYLSEDSGKKSKINRLILRYTFNITEK